MNLVDAGYEVREAPDAETAQRVAQAAAARSRCCSTGCCPGSRDWRLRSSCAATRARASCRSSWSPRAPTRRTRSRGSKPGSTTTSPSRSRPRELKARIKSVLRRRAPEAAQETLEAGVLKLDPATHRVTVSTVGTGIARTDRIPLAAVPAGAARARASRERSSWTMVWGDHVYIEERTVDVHVRRLRVALEPFGADQLIETVRGSGYRLVSLPPRRSPHVGRVDLSRISIESDHPPGPGGAGHRRGRCRGRMVARRNRRCTRRRGDRRCGDHRLPPVASATDQRLGKCAA